jgi:hypothetical protein
MDTPPSIIPEGMKKGSSTIFLPVIKDIFLLMYKSFSLFLSKPFFISIDQPTHLPGTSSRIAMDQSIIKAFALWYRLGLVVGSKKLTHELY